MIKHIVLFQFEESTTLENMLEIKEALENLKGKIDVLKHIEAGVNTNSKEVYHLALTTEFENMEDLQTYAVHPEHLEVVKMIRPILAQRACVDYEF